MLPVHVPLVGGVADGVKVTVNVRLLCAAIVCDSPVQVIVPTAHV